MFRRLGQSVFEASDRAYGAAMPADTRDRYDSIAFLDLIEQGIPRSRQVIAMTDNLSTRRTQEVEEWLDDHPHWCSCFTPTHASWLNQVKIFFSILARRLLKYSAFDSEQDLAEQMLAFVEHYIRGNASARKR